MTEVWITFRGGWLVVGGLCHWFPTGNCYAIIAHYHPHCFAGWNERLLFFARWKKKTKNKAVLLAERSREQGKMKSLGFTWHQYYFLSFFPDVINTDPKCSGYKIAAKCHLALIQWRGYDMVGLFEPQQAAHSKTEAKEDFYSRKRHWTYFTVL